MVTDESDSFGEFRAKLAEAKVEAYIQVVQTNFRILMAAIFAVILGSEKLPASFPFPVFAPVSTVGLVTGYLVLGVLGLHQVELRRAVSKTFGIPEPKSRVLQYVFFVYTLVGFVIFVWLLEGLIESKISS